MFPPSLGEEEVEEDTPAGTPVGKKKVAVAIEDQGVPARSGPLPQLGGYTVRPRVASEEEGGTAYGDGVPNIITCCGTEEEMNFHPVMAVPSQPGDAAREKVVQGEEEATRVKGADVKGVAAEEKATHSCDTPGRGRAWGVGESTAEEARPPSPSFFLEKGTAVTVV